MSGRFEQHKSSRIAPDLDRRALLKAMGASLALAGLAGCGGEADETALPYVTVPPGELPGESRWYASAVRFAGFAQPVLGKTYDGRPVKLEGNPDHPASGGATDAFTQAALLGLYDPSRSSGPRHLGRPAGWDPLDGALAERRSMVDARQGEGLRVLTGAVTSPTLIRQMAALLEKWPRARWHVHEPVADASALAAAARMFGRPLALHPQIAEAGLIVSLDDDFLGPGPRQTHFARQWARRRIASRSGNMESRLMMAEPTLSATGSVARHRIAASPQALAEMLSATAVAFGLDAPARDLSPEQTRWVRRAVRGLKAAGEGLVLVGAHLPVEMHELAILLNERIGAVGRTLVATDPIRKEPAEDFHLASLVRDMAGGGVSELVTLGVNPAYAAPAALGFADACRKVDFHLHAGLHMDETAALAHWHAPLQHDLESWSDGLAADGTAGIIQPLVRPFRSVRSAHVLLDRLMGGGATERDIVRATWRRRWQGEDFEGRWADALYRGHVSGSRPASLVPEVTGPRSAPASREPPSALMLAVRPDPSVWDGSQADNAWLQETPKPISKIAWGNALLVAPKLAAAHGIADGDEIAVAADGREIAGPAVLAEGQDEGTVTAFLGHGRRRSELAAGIGYDIYALLPAAGGLDMPLSSLRRTGARSMVATTQPSKRMDGFDFVRQVAHPQDQAAPARTEPSFYPVPKTQSTQWGMSIDLDLCIGCNACVVACTAENNVPVVGKDLVAQGREMHWLRVDHYIEGTKDGLRSHFQPVPCMHCEQAPCEMGCPVNATVHSSDGLNLQVYNRCIGTRTCSSYCPYKVRRFNWFDFTGTDPESVRAMRNPDVTVRSRGVMEKCTYCVQRIEEARIVAKKDGRPIRDGEVVTACQQACPTQAIVFGDIADPQSAVSRSKAGPRDYTLLEEANTRPRTTYLARIMEPGDEEQG